MIRGKSDDLCKEGHRHWHTVYPFLPMNFLILTTRVFRDGGFFMLVTQFQELSHFIMAYLEDYKFDPARAQPLLTFSVLDDLIAKT
eukprot:scaffold29670_cov55-Attheya_sp.AAC.10